MYVVQSPVPQTRCRRGRGGPRGLHGIGDSLFCPGPVRAQLDEIAAQLANASADLDSTGRQLMAAVQATGLQPDAAHLLMEQRNDLERLISALTGAYRAFCGSVPPGLSGLGLIPAIPITTAAVTVAALFAAIAIWWTYEQQLKDKVNLVAQENITYAQQQLADRQAAGDTTGAAQWQAALNQLGPQSFGDFLTAYKWPLLIGGGGLIAIMLLRR